MALCLIIRSRSYWRCSGFQAFSVGSHHFVGALDADRLGGENSYRIASFVQAVTGRPSYWPPLVISTKTMRATLLASATAVRLNLYLTVLRSSIPLAHRRMASLWPRRWRSVAQAPTTRSLRTYRSPVFVMRPSRVLPPVVTGTPFTL